MTWTWPALILVGLMPLGALCSDEFVGAQSCAGCHQVEYESWKGSHHDLAMMHATEESVLGNFDDTSFTIHGVTSRFFKRNGRYFINTDGPDGTLVDFEIGFTFGVEPLQQYLIAFPDGRMQALPLAWDTRSKAQGGQRWFHLYPDEHIGSGDEFHWTGPQQNWNYMCADCHSTNLDKGYQPATDTFTTTWSEINVACEACHGPARRHLEWARGDDKLKAQDVRQGLSVLFHERQGVRWPTDAETGMASRSQPNHDRTEIGVCATCHSRRGTLKQGAAGDPSFLNYHMPALLTGALYHDDGQIDGEVYVWGSFIQSKMHAAGVTCSDCHDPHSLDLKAPGQAVCSQCHAPAKFASKKHHGHRPDSPGADCLACHMPEKTYMVVDPRRDHSIRSPRPDLSLEFGTPNACTQCHSDKSRQWAATAFTKQFPDAARPFQHWTRAFQQARDGLPQAEVSLLGIINNPDTPEIARATAVYELRNYLSPLSGQVLQKALHDESPLVRIAALRAMGAIPPANRFSFAGHLLSDPFLAVRIEAADMLASTPVNQMAVTDRGQLELALGDYFAAQQYNADRAESQVNLGNLQAESGNAVEAEKYYRQAIALNPAFSPAYVNIADLYRTQGMEAESRSILEKAAVDLPGDASIHHALGLSLVRSGSSEAAMAELARAAELAPDVSRYAYVYGIGLNSVGQADKAVAALASAHLLHPNDRNITFALATIERDRGNTGAAIKWTQQLLRINPGDQGASELMGILESESQ